MDKRQRLLELAQLFLKLGLIGFGGPAAHIALMEEEVVRRRAWLTRKHFLEMLGVVNLIPGPNSTEMAIQLGLLRAGGAVVAGRCFILPAFGIVLALAIFYVSYETRPQIGAVLYGLKPVIIAIIAVAALRFGQTALKQPLHWTLGVLAGGLGWWGQIDQLVILLGAGLIMLIVSRETWGKGTVAGLVLPALVSQAGQTATLPQLAWVFLKIGATLFGSGYLLVAYLEQEVVVNNHWLTRPQLFDAIAIGQFTPGPVLTTATFVGYLIDGLPGAIVATVAIFLPSFLFVLASHYVVNRLRQSTTTLTFLAGVNAAVVGLICSTLLTLGQTALIDPLTILLCLSSLILLWRFKIDSTWLILGGGVIGIIFDVAT